MEDAVFYNADHAGWLHKQGHFNKEFKLRFFVLRGAVLTYHEDLAAARRGRAKGTVTVTGSVRHLRPREAELPASHGESLAFHSPRKKVGLTSVGFKTSLFQCFPRQTFVPVIASNHTVLLSQDIFLHFGHFRPPSVSFSYSPIVV